MRSLTRQRRFGQPIIGLLPEAESVTNVHFMEDVQGEEGRGKLNVTACPVRMGLSMWSPWSTRCAATSRWLDCNPYHALAHGHIKPCRN